MKRPYEKLFELSRTIATYSSIQALLEWDQETYMPSEAADFRSAELSLVAGLTHQLKTSPKFKRLLSQLIDLESGRLLDATLSDREAAALKMWRRDYLQAAKLPASFVKTFSTTCSKALHTWSKAKKENSFKDFKPHLEKIVSLCRKQADFLGFQDHPYDALLDLYEPGMTVRTLSPLFQKIKQPLIQLIQGICSKPPAKTPFFQHTFDFEKQLKLSHKLLHIVGLPSSKARIDLSSHPFCSGLHPKDTRMTTRLLPHNPISNILSTLHEAGHGLYNAGLLEEAYGSPLGQQISLGIDESQSRWWENWIGRSRPFWHFFYPTLQETFPEQLGSVSLEDFYRGIHQVEPSFIRVEADEVTYSLHVILRFEIEKQLIEGSLAVKDLPEAWNHKMQELLQITPPNDALGCLQDIHWSMGSFGYFPTYVLGNLYAAQLFQTFEQDRPHWKDEIAKGTTTPTRQWLIDHVHRYGRHYLPEELIEKVTGKPLAEQPFIDYLRNKYLSL